MSDPTTAVPQPYFGPLGLVLPTEDAILTGVQADINTALGGGVNPQLTTPQGQIAMTETAVIGDSLALFAWFMNGVDPATSSGRLQDAIGRIYFMTRIPSAPTVQPCVCTGLNTAPIPIGALASDPNTGLLWICQTAGTIDVSGSVTLDFACATSGPIAGPASLEIYQQIAGWESITPTGDAVLGNNVESPQQFEQRRAASVAANASQILDAILGQVLAVSGVLDVYCIENDLATPELIGGVTIGPNSIYVCVLGGSSTAIATAIWTKKGPGCAYNGNTAVVVSDPNPLYVPPSPSYTVRFQIPTIVAFAALVVLRANTGIPANALLLIQTSIINAFAGLDGGPRAGIGSTVLSSRYYGGVASLGSWAQIVVIQTGILASGAYFTASIAGFTLTVSVLAAGTIAVGQWVQDATGAIAPGTIITGGSGSTWTVSVSQVVAPEPMTATILENEATVNIDQVPGISAANIQMITQA